MQIQGNYAPAGATWYASQAAEETKQLSAEAGQLFSLFVTNKKASTVYLWIFDSLTATGTVLIPAIKIDASGGYISLDGLIPYFATGLFLASSSTQDTYTATTTADLRICALFK